MFGVPREGTDWSYYTGRAEQCFRFCLCRVTVVSEGMGSSPPPQRFTRRGNTWQQPKPQSGGV